MRNLSALLIICIIAVFVLLQSLFVVDEREKAIVTRFGAIDRTVEEQGLNFKMPFVDNVNKYDSRLLTLDSDEFSVLFSDNRRLVVDAFSRWRISDVVKYHLAVVQQGDAGARVKLAGILEDSLRNVLGKVDTNAILSADRTKLMLSILDATKISAAEMGVEIVDVRIVRADLPEANLQATFDRMSAERKQEAADERARGAEAARRITAAAEREAVQIVSSARKESEIIKGEADAQSSKIFADAYEADPEFFDFYRSMQAYRSSLQGSNTSVVLSPDSDFFRFLETEAGAN